MERNDPVWLETSSRWLKLRSEIAILEEEERKNPIEVWTLTATTS